LNQFIPQLIELDLSYNNLDDVEITFQTANNIVTLGLSNTLQTKSLSDILTKSNSLHIIDLSGNRLKRVSISEIGDSIKTLNLSNNNIRDLDELGSALSLQYLYLSFNELKMIKKIWLEGLNGLSELYLSNNMIESIEPDCFSSKSLFVLDLQNNRIKYLSYIYFDQNLAGSFSLRTVLISNNTLNMLDLTGFDSLNEIYSSNNGLTNQNIIDFRFVSSEVTILSLSSNNLTQMEQAFLSKAGRMQNLNLSHNQIDNVEPYSFSSLRILKNLDLSYNQIANLSIDLCPLPAILFSLFILDSLV
jgi:Leucine-rich repeat (LRR) protein